MIALYLILTLASFYGLAKISSKYFIPSLDHIAHQLKMPSHVSGATLMAIGSSAPELFISIIALLKPGNHAEIGMGTIVGSAIFNILVIVGASAAAKNIRLSWQPIIRDTAFYLISIILLILSFKDGIIDIFEASAMLITYAIYVTVVVKWKKFTLLPEADPIPDANFKNNTLVFSLSIISIALLSWILVESAVQIAHGLNIPEAIIALTILALGTSIPDTMSSVIVARQGRGDMAITNSIGSNVFDILIGLGLPWMITILFFTDKIKVKTEDLFSSVLLLFASVIIILGLFLIRRWEIGRKSGYLLIAIYLAYLVWAILNI